MRPNALLASAVAATELFFGGCYAQSVSLNVAQNLNFPTIAIPQAGTADVSVSALNSLVSGTGTVINGTASRGQFNLTVDQSGSSVSLVVDITDVSVSDPNVSLGSFTGLYRGYFISSFPSQTLPLPDAGASTPFYLGATLTASPGVQQGPVTATFTIRVTVL